MRGSVPAEDCRHGDMREGIQDSVGVPGAWRAALPAGRQENCRLGERGKPDVRCVQNGGQRILGGARIAGPLSGERQQDNKERCDDVP